MTLRFSGSLRQNHLFRRLYQKGKSAVGSFMVLYCRPNGTAFNRVGVTVSVKLGCAVRRNRIRRRLREIYRLNEEQFLPGFDLVVVARGRAAHAQYRELEREYLALAKRLRLLRTEAPS